MANLIVLCSNGRRQNVKITSNSKLLQVLEEVCQKQGFLPPEDYSLIHGRTTVDLTLAFRYSNLLNNAKLELVKSSKSRAEEEVLIALQLEDGSRQQAQFNPSVTLWEILLHWENQPNSPYKDKLTMIDTSEIPVRHPVCIYMREEVIGEMALKNTTLRKLALTGGKAVIRMVHRGVDDNTLAKIIQNIESSNVKKAKLEEIASQKFIEQHSEQTKAEQISMLHCSEACAQSSVLSIDSGDQQEPMEVDSGTNNMPSLNSSIVDNVQTDLANTSNQLDITNVRDNTQQVSSDNSINRLRDMNIPGVEIFTPQDFADLTPEEQVIATRLARRFVPGLMRGNTTNSQSVMPSINRSRPAKQNFTDFKFPEETKGKAVYHNELSEVNRQEFKPCDRETVLYSLDETLLSSKTVSQELSDDFFEVNENDLRILMTDLQKSVESIDNQSLMTKSMRQAAIEEKYERYKKVVIRIQFANKLVLQGLFRPRETVFAVHKYVKENLEVKNMSFYLYTTPPKSVLRDQTLTLLEANLVPATLIYFGTESEHDTFVSTSLINAISPRLKAEELAAVCLNTDQIPCTSNDDSKIPKLSSISSGASTSNSKEKKVPKWLKLGKK